MDILFQPMDFPPLESVMSKCLVSLCHLMHIFFSLHGCTSVVCCIHDLVCQPVFYGLLASFAAEHALPAKRQSLASFRSSLDRHLVSSTTVTSCFYHKNRHDIVHCFFKYIDCWFSSFCFDFSKCAVYDLLSDALLTV